MPRSATLAVAAFALLAGCTAPAPEGTARDLQFAPTVAGTVVLDYQPFEGANPAAGTPAGQAQCAHGQVPTSPVPPCKGPWTDVQVNVTAPQAGDATYSVYLANATTELLVAELAEGALAGNMATYTGRQNFTHLAAPTHVELRLGDLVVAHAGATEGPQPFTLDGALTAVEVSALAWKGATLTGTAQGLPANATFQGNLYLAGPDGTVQMEPAESFTIQGNGPFTYTSPGRTVGEFVEFHIHVGHSKLNLYKAAIESAA
jgi:hypothetical protein